MRRLELVMGTALVVFATIVLNCAAPKTGAQLVFKRANDFYAVGQMDSVIAVIREHLRKNGRDPEAYRLVPLVMDAYLRKGEFAQVHRLTSMYRQKFPESSFLPRITYLDSIANIAEKTSIVPSFQPADYNAPVTPLPTATNPAPIAPPPTVAYTDPVVSQSALVKYVAVVEIELDKEFGASANMNKAEVRHMTAELRNVAVNNLPSDKYKIMTSESVYAQGGAVLEECADENCVIMLGRKIGADYIVRGIISKLGTNLTMSVEMYDTDNENLVASSIARSGSTTDLLDKTVSACVDMYKKFENEQNSKRSAR